MISTAIVIAVLACVLGPALVGFLIMSRASIIAWAFTPPRWIPPPPPLPVKVYLLNAKDPTIMSNPILDLAQKLSDARANLVAHQAAQVTAQEAAEAAVQTARASYDASVNDTATAFAAFDAARTALSVAMASPDSPAVVAPATIPAPAPVVGEPAPVVAPVTA